MSVRIAGPILLVLLGILFRPPVGVAQRMPARLQPFRVSAADSARVYPPSYWFEGAAIGAAVLGATTVFVASAFCGYDDSGSSCHPGVYVGAAALGGALGAGVGALVGGLFDAPHARPLRGHRGRAALMGAVAGALWSVGFLCHGLGDGCGSAEPVSGTSVSAVGALAGWLVAR
jgi:hypothetical protein